MAINTVKKAAYAPQYEITIRAEQVLSNFARLKSFETLVNADKVWFRDVANGEQLKEVIPGVGSVSVARPSEPSSGTSLVFDANAFDKLDSETKALLRRKGVVNSKRWEKKGSEAAVTITLNV